MGWQDERRDAQRTSQDKEDRREGSISQPERRDGHDNKVFVFCFFYKMLFSPICICVPLCMSVHPPHASRSSLMSAEALDPLEVELQTAVSYHVGARTLGATYHLEP